MHRITSWAHAATSPIMPRSFPLTGCSGTDREHLELHMLERDLATQLMREGPGQGLLPAASAFVTALQAHYEHEQRQFLGAMVEPFARTHHEDHADILASAHQTADELCRAETRNGIQALTFLYDRIFRHIIFFDLDFLTVCQEKRA